MVLLFSAIDNWYVGLSTELRFSVYLMLVVMLVVTIPALTGSWRASMYTAGGIAVYRVICFWMRDAR